MEHIDKKILKALGITPKEALEAMRLAEIPTEEFEALIEGPDWKEAERRIEEIMQGKPAERILIPEVVSSEPLKLRTQELARKLGIPEDNQRLGQAIKLVLGMLRSSREGFTIPQFRDKVLELCPDIYKWQSESERKKFVLHKVRQFVKRNFR